MAIEDRYIFEVLLASGENDSKKICISLYNVWNKKLYESSKLHRKLPDIFTKCSASICEGYYI